MHGPHHSAQKWTSTALSDWRTSTSNVESVTVVASMLAVPPGWLVIVPPGGLVTVPSGWLLIVPPAAFAGVKSRLVV